ncbi:MAG TPA: lipocalin family protein [Bacteroidales bacterium]|nr:lipocalin family protein [Bacteroidales bacterium]
MRLIKIIGIMMMLLSLSFCRTVREPLEVEESVNLERYAGKWYEIARLPNRFEKGLKCVTATYKLCEDGRIQVINRGHKIAGPGKVEEAKGVAHLKDKGQPAKLKVTFFWPFSGKYWILDLDERYRYALVGSPSRKYLWILSRSKTMDEKTYDRLLSEARARGFDISEMIRTLQDCDN